MKLFRLTVPHTDNAGDNTHALQIKLEAAIFSYVGGYTRIDGPYGCWKDPVSGTVYAEPNVMYEVATTAEQFRRILRTAFKLFEDQQALFWCELGQATVEYRPAQEAA